MLWRVESTSKGTLTIQQIFVDSQCPKWVNSIYKYSDSSKQAQAYPQNVSSIKKTTWWQNLSKRCFLFALSLLKRVAKSTSSLGKRNMIVLLIVETQFEDVLAYILKIIISIIDGQYSFVNLFSARIMSTLNVGISISKIGFTAQIKVIKQEADKSKL